MSNEEWKAATTAIRDAEERGDLVEAHRLADDAVCRYPDCAEVHALRATILLWLGRRDSEARTALQRASELGPDLAVTWAARADVESIIGDATVGKAAADRALELDNSDPWVLHRCVSAYNVARCDATLATARRLVELCPDSEAAISLLIGVLGISGEADEAEEVLSQAEVRFPDSPAIQHKRADALLSQERLEDAVCLLYQVVRNQPIDSSAWSDLAVTLARLGRMDEAETAAKKALEISARCDGALLAMALACQARGQMWQAAEWLQKAKTVIGEVGMGRLTDAAAALRKGDYQAAIAIVDGALPHGRNKERDAYLGIKAKALLRLGRLDEALAVANEMTVTGGTPTAACALKGSILRARGGFAQAVDVLRGGLEAQPESGEIRAELLRSLHSLGSTDEERALIDDIFVRPAQTPGECAPMILAIKESGYRQEAHRLAAECATRHPQYAKHFQRAASNGTVDYLLGRLRLALSWITS